MSLKNLSLDPRIRLLIENVPQRDNTLLSLKEISIGQVEGNVTINKLIMDT